MGRLILLGFFLVLCGCSASESLTSDKKLDEIDEVINSNRSVWDVKCDFYYSHPGDEKYAHHAKECEEKINLLYAKLKEKEVIKNETIKDLENPELWKKFQARFPRRAFYYTDF